MPLCGPVFAQFSAKALNFQSNGYDVEAEQFFAPFLILDCSALFAHAILKNMKNPPCSICFVFLMEFKFINPM